MVKNKIKGIRIMTWFTNIFLWAFLVVFLSLFLMLFVIYVQVTQKSIEQITSNFYAPLYAMFISLVISGLAFILLYVFARERMQRISNLRKLCKLIYSNGFYISEIKNKQKQITYFPEFYYYENEGEIFITIKLDGSKFHDNFLSLGTKFEHIYNSELESKLLENSYVKYRLLKHDNLKRLNIKDPIYMEEGEYRVPLMSNLNWEILKHPHAFIIGPTGSGKTNLLFYLIKYLIKLKCNLNIIDPKMSNLSRLNSVLGSENVVSEKDEILNKLDLADEEIKNRYSSMYNFGEFKVNQSFLNYNLKPYVIIFDEFASFIDSCYDNQKKIAYDRVTNIILKGRQVGVFIIVLTQNTEEKFISTDVMNNFGLIVTLGNMSRNGYSVIFQDIEKDYSKNIEKGQGYIYLNGVYDTVLEFYSPLIPDDYDFIDDVKRIMLESGNTMQIENINQLSMSI
ncbi:MAG: FtsK/SpoIIIE domain-containing protein [Oscillospiraceae bacterium]|nr:FtsK/SpoIIIE domain-containing protein [Oscillospiraceae bacterium]